VLSAALYGSAEIAYNVFDTYRGAEAGVVYGHVLAMIRHLFGTDAFMIPPYQLGQGNDEALESGAWWFYQKSGFRPRDARARRLMRRELASIKARPTHRSSRTTLARLSRSHLYFHLGHVRDDVLGELPLANVGLAVTDYLAQRFGSDRERATAVCAREAAALLREETLARLSAPERLAWERWAPLVLVLPGVRGWSAADRRALARVIRAKGGPRESDYVRLFDRHRRLRKTLRVLAEKNAPE
jgi:hypothetical protein